MGHRIHRNNRHRDQGFTLIELLVVIIIIGILAAIAIPVFLNQRKRAVDGGIKSDMKNLAAVAESYTADYPYQMYFGDPDTTTGLPTTLTMRAAIGSTSEYRARQSPGNTIAIKGGPADGYCIRGYNTTSGNANSTTRAFWYDSKNGGLYADAPRSQPTGGACQELLTATYPWVGLS